MLLRYDLRCPACSRVDSCDAAQMTARLRGVGRLKRTAKPDEELLAELFSAAAGGFRCLGCSHVGLVAAPALVENVDWGGTRLCETCGKPIPAERVELFPNTRVCVACQRASESGQDTSTPEYCPKCGSIMTLRQSQKGGITRYVLTCPACH